MHWFVSRVDVRNSWTELHSPGCFGNGGLCQMIDCQLTKASIAETSWISSGQFLHQPARKPQYMCSPLVSP